MKKAIKQQQKTVGEEYLVKIFSMLRKMNGVALTQMRSRFKNSEMRLLSEVISAKSAGERIISTQIAERLGITRSAVSQMVNKLEERGVVKRVKDKNDRKIAYVELTPKAEKLYEEEKGSCSEFVEILVEKFGEEKMDELLELSDRFIDTVADIKRE